MSTSAFPTPTAPPYTGAAEQHLHNDTAGEEHKNMGSETKSSNVSHLEATVLISATFM